MMEDSKQETGGQGDTVVSTLSGEISEMSMSSMNQNSGSLPVSSSFSERLSSSSHQQQQQHDDGGSKSAAMLVTSNPTSISAMSGSIPPPFRSNIPPNRQYPVPNSLPAVLPNSVSAPSIPSALDATSPQNGEHRAMRALQSPSSKIETIKNWSISTYKCTKQMMFERMGKSSRTVDSELESRIEHLRDIKRRYLQVLGLSRAFTSHFYHVIQTQQALAEAFADLAQKSPELQQEFLYNADTQRNLHKNGEILLSALNFFLSSVNTLCNKTIEDTISTIRQYESSRLEYDAYRSDLELMLQMPKTEATSVKIEEAQKNFNVYKISYEKLRDDVNIKLQFLDENRIKVMHKQLLLFHNAISAYFSGNQQALESTLKQFSIKPYSE
ncbi:arfaptin-2 isoform X2 [Folsomia candida]|uniref:arfaptin-2 isoform X2 n=1 Tax=Folsomia candida TaxID=158441 RepID=UPI000B8FE87C|nr:arfaptin-2 isoform X2 [Folsomia candida]